MDARWVVVLLLLVLQPTTRALAQSRDADFLAALRDLPSASFVEKEAIVDRVVATRHANVLPFLAALLDDRVVAREADHKVFIRNTEASGPVIDLIDPVSMKRTDSAREDELTKIGTNNRFRRFLKSAIARFALSSADASVRLNAIKEITRTPDDSTTELLRQRVGGEQDAAVRYEMVTAVAIADLDDPDPKVRLAAITTLADRLRPQVRNRLAAMFEPASEASVAEPDAAVRRAAVTTVRSIDRARRFYSGVETLFFGLSLGSVLVLVATGLAITFGVMGVINMAHGELMMLGAYTTYVVQQLMPHRIGLSMVIAIPAAFVVAGAAGILLERIIIRFLYGRPLETLLATFGVSLALQQFVRSVFSANNRSVETPAWLSGTLQINEALAFTFNRLYILIFTGIVFVILLVVLRSTRFGLEIRTVAQNRSMARAMGIRTDRVDAMTFGLGSGLAGIAGVALSQLTNVGPNLGQAYIIDSFMVVVFGGVGNLWGTLIGGMSLGIVKKVLEPYAGAVLANVLVLVALILFIQRRPRGLFPEAGRAAEGV